MNYRTILCLFLLLPLPSAFAQAPELINYQGRVLTGTNLVQGAVDVEFRLFDAPVGGSSVYAETQMVTVVDGLFSTAIGAASPAPGALRSALTNGQLYLELTVDGTTLTPRERLASVAYALSPDGHSLDAADGSPTDVLQVNDGGFVGIGRTLPITGAEVFGIGRDTTSFGGMYVETADGGIPFYGYSTDGSVDAYHYYNDSDSRWGLFVGGAERVSVDAANGNVGLSATDPDARLHVSGQVKITGGNPGAGKVLTSDAVGLASWSVPSAGVGSSEFIHLAHLLNQMAPEMDLPFGSLQEVACTNAAVFELDVGGSPLGAVIGFTGWEAISETYEFRVAVRATSPGLSLDAQIGATAELRFNRNGAVTRFGGIVDEFSLASYDGASAVYVVKIVPEAACLDRTAQNRIFQENSIDTIIDDIFTSTSLTPPNQLLNGTYNQASMRIQYDETDLQFLQRIAAFEGLSFFFLHTAGSVGMRVGDDNGYFLNTPGGPFSYYGHQASAPTSAEEYIRTLHRKRSQFTGETVLRDYQFQSTAVLEENSSVASGKGRYEEFGANVGDAGFLNALADVRLDRFQTEGRPVEGSSNVGDLKAGYLFDVTDSSGGTATDTYLATEVRHVGLVIEDGSSTCYQYGNEFAAIPASEPFRPARIPPKPAVKGLSTAVVTGPAGEEIFVDEFGRVKVQFHWDTVGPFDETSSAWIRVLQSPSMMFLPRVGDEVLVGFINGDVDRPVVLGNLFNGADQPPVSLPADKAVSVIRTTSTPGGLDENQIRMTDTAGSEELLLDAAQELILNANGTITVNAGSVLSLSAPTVAVNTDALFVEAGTDDVGVGTSNPGGDFEVRGDADQTGILISNDAADGDPILRFRFGGSTQFALGVDDTDNDFKIVEGFNLGSVPNLRLQIDGTTGDISIPGNLSKGGGSFKIDHPLEPARKFLSHSFVESPDMMNIYNGVVVLDDTGQAVIEMPDWFSALNRDFRYQLTPIGGPGPDLHIARMLCDNQFSIAGGTPGASVSWQITGIRQDPFANAHRIPVEEDKPAELQGTYLHPDVHRERDEGGDLSPHQRLRLGTGQEPEI